MDKEKCPGAWKTIADMVKKVAGWKCKRCQSKHDPVSGRYLIVHHWDGDSFNCERDNLVALCQRCQLQITACPDDPDQILLVPSFNEDWQIYIRKKRDQGKRG